MSLTAARVFPSWFCWRVFYLPSWVALAPVCKTFRRLEASLMSSRFLQTLSRTSFLLLFNFFRSSLLSFPALRGFPLLALLMSFLLSFVSCFSSGWHFQQRCLWCNKQHVSDPACLVVVLPQLTLLGLRKDLSLDVSCSALKYIIKWSQHEPL